MRAASPNVTSEKIWLSILLKSVYSGVFKESSWQGSAHSGGDADIEMASCAADRRQTCHTTQKQLSHYFVILFTCTLCCAHLNVTRWRGLWGNNVFNSWLQVNFTKYSLITAFEMKQNGGLRKYKHPSYSKWSHENLPFKCIYCICRDMNVFLWDYKMHIRWSSKDTKSQQS